AFRQVADLPLGLEGVALDVATEDAGGAGGRRQEPGEHLHGGGFAGPVGAEKAQHFPLLDLEAQAVHGRVLRKTLGQVSYFDHGLSPARLRPRPDDGAGPTECRPDYKESPDGIARQRKLRKVARFFRADARQMTFAATRSMRHTIAPEQMLAS